MVVTQLLGGLGNQMFQYAVGRALAARRATALRLYTLPVKGYPLRPYALGDFAIEAKELSDEERDELRINVSPRWHLRALIGRLIGHTELPVIRERSFAFDSTVFDAPATCYLQGYWQSPKYFSGIERQIRKEFTVRAPLGNQSLEVARQIDGSVAVSIHVRRGDYAGNQHTNRYHGTCDPDYYKAAEQYLLERLENLRLFVFSDDPNWAEANLQFQSPFIVLRHNGPERDHEDLWLMSLCHHHIIANSTFSWWGAWLCANRDKIVVAPQNWFRDAGHSTADLIPNEWVRV